MKKTEMIMNHCDLMLSSSFEISQNRIYNPILSVCIRVHPWFSFSFRQVFSLVEEPARSDEFFSPLLSCQVLSVP
jgi:hypothetical protein